MPYLCVVIGDDGPTPTISVVRSDEPDAVPLTRAFRKAKLAAGWEAPHLTKLDGLQETGIVVLASQPWMSGGSPHA